MNSTRKQELANKLMDNNRQEDRLAQRKRPAAYRKVSTRFFISVTEWKQLRYHEKRWLAAYAVGCTMPKAVLSGRSAARILGIWVIATTPEPVELVAQRGKAPSRKQWPPGVVYRDRSPGDATTQHFDRLRTTDALTTVFDIALRHGFAEGLVAMDWLLREGMPRHRIEEAAAHLGRVRNIATLRHVIAHAVDNSLSPYESYARALLLQAGIGGWQVNARITIPPHLYVADLLRGRLIVEIDGAQKYDGTTFAPTDTAIREEREREKRLQNAGYVVVRVSPEQLLDDARGFLTTVTRMLDFAEIPLTRPA